MLTKLVSDLGGARQWKRIAQSMESRSDQQCMQRWNILEKNKKKELEQRAAAEAMGDDAPEEGDKRKRVRNASSKAGLQKQESTVSDRRRVPKQGNRGSRTDAPARNRRSTTNLGEDDTPVPEEAKNSSGDRQPEEAVRQ